MAIKAIINNTEKEIEQIKNSDEQDIDYVYSRIGDTEVEGEPPISIKSIGGNLADYRIYGNTVGGESVGDLVESGEHAGEYEMPVTVEGKNLLQNTATSQTINGVTFTVNSDGSITCNGTANASAPSILYIPFTLPIKLYELSGCPDSGSASTYRVDIRNIDYSMYKYNGNSVIDDGTGCLFDGGNNQYCIRIAPGYTCENLTFYPMIRLASIEDDTYEPYHAPVTTPIYLPEQIRKVGDEAEYIDYGEQKMHRIGADDVDVTLPALPTLPGTNTFSVNTSIQPSNIYIKDNFDYKKVFTATRTIEDELPLNYRNIEDNDSTLDNYRIYGNTVGGESVGDRTGNLFDKTNFIQTNLVSQVGNLIVPDPYTISTILPCNPNTKYTISKIVTNRFFIWGCTDYPTTDKYCNRRIVSGNDSPSLTFTTGNDDNYLLVMLFYQRQPTDPTIEDVKGSLMFNYGEALPYEPYGYRVPVMVTNGTDTETTNIYLSKQIKKVGDEAEYIDYGEQKHHRVRKNLLQNTATSQTINGVTFTVNEDDSVTCNGTSTSRYYSLFRIPCYLVAGNYTISGCPVGGTSGTYRVDIRISPNGTMVSHYADTGEGATISIDESGWYDYTIRIQGGYTVDDVTFKPMIRKADIEDDTYEPYIENTDLDVTLPALPTLSGTNTLSVGTEVQPSRVYLKGKIKEIN